MSKYAIVSNDNRLPGLLCVGYNLSLAGFLHQFKGSFQEAVDNFFERDLKSSPKDPFEFALNPENYTVIILTDSCIVTDIMTVAAYAETLAGDESLTFNPENLNNSTQNQPELT